jgi:hypothetical protein
MSISSVRDTGVLAEFTGDQLGRVQTHPGPFSPGQVCSLAAQVATFRQNPNLIPSQE